MRHVAALAIYLAAAFAFYAPPYGANGFTYFGYGSDPLAYIWFLNWWPYAMLHHLPLLYCRWVDAPAGALLAWKTGLPALGVLAAPFTLRFGAVAVANTLFVLAPALTAFGGYLAAFALTRRAGASFAAGIAFGFTSYMLAEMQGHLNLVFICPLPVAVALCIRAYQRGWPAWKLALPLGVDLAVQFGISQELLAGFGVFGAVFLVVQYGLDDATRPGLRRIAPGIAAGILLCGVLVSPYIWEMLRGYRVARGGITPPVAVSNDLLGFFLPTPIDWLGGMKVAPLAMRYPGNISEASAYIGVPLLLLLGVICWRHQKLRSLGVFTAITAICSLGPWLHVAGKIIAPLLWLPAPHLPILGAMLPARFMLFAWGGIAALLALWLTQPGRKPPRYLALTLCLLPLLPSRQMDRNWSTLQVPALLTGNSIPQNATILILPQFGDEMGYQYAANMRFKLAAQGYIGTGDPQPFAAWPLFQPLHNGEYASINPKQLGNFLNSYQVDEVVITPQRTYDYRQNRLLDPEAARQAATQLMLATGWHITRQTQDGTELMTR